MTLSSYDDFTALKTIGRIVADTLEAMGNALELDALGHMLLEKTRQETAELPSMP